ncbi:hypothetical protein D5086_031145 [Populus alba]|uniref:Uncharacterized protein n=1 Tax=Populus alba TaxID=43335 RepID=A0ACC4AQG7_POPAL
MDGHRQGTFQSQQRFGQQMEECNSTQLKSCLGSSNMDCKNPSLEFTLGAICNLAPAKQSSPVKKLNSMASLVSITTEKTVCQNQFWFGRSQALNLCNPLAQDPFIEDWKELDLHDLQLLEPKTGDFGIQALAVLGL